MNTNAQTLKKHQTDYPATQIKEKDPIVDDLETMALATRYNAWIFDQFRPYIGNRIIEIGAGIGTYTEELAKKELVVPVEVYEPCFLYLQRRFAGADNVKPVMTDAASKDFKSLKQYRPDTILCINVLEHIEEDDTFLEHANKMLPPHGRLLLYVPAHKILLGSIDKIVGHHRRYGKFQLSMKLDIAGFDVERIYHMNFPTVIPWFINNRILKSTNQSPQQVLTFDKWIVPWLSKIEAKIKFPFGLSLVAIAKK